MRFLYLQIIASGLLLWRLFGSPCPSYAANKPVGSDSAKLAAVDPTPSVAIVSPVDGASVTETNLTVRVNVRLPAGSTLRSVRAMVDGRLAAQVRGVRLTTSPAAPMDAPFTHELTVSISPRDCVLTVVAETSALKLEPASVSLHWSGPDASRNPEQRPRLYVLAVGVSDYQQSELRLRFAGKDARDLAEAFSKQGRTLYRSIETKILTDAGAKKNGILDGLEWLQRSTTAKDIAVLFLAGHGITDPSTGNYYFLPFDADMNGIKRSMIAESELRDTLSSIPGKVLLFLDVGGSMDDHIRVCEELFSACRTEFKHLEHYYFHNCVYEGVWKDNRRRHNERIPTQEVLHRYGNDYKLIFVGDASMSPYEILHPGGGIEHWNEEPGAVWLGRLKEAFPHAIWLNPEPEHYWQYRQSIELVRKLLGGNMYPLTLDGLERGMRQLSK